MVTCQKIKKIEARNEWMGWSYIQPILDYIDKLIMETERHYKVKSLIENCLVKTLIISKFKQKANYNMRPNTSVFVDGRYEIRLSSSIFFKIFRFLMTSITKFKVTYQLPSEGRHKTGILNCSWLQLHFQFGASNKWHEIRGNNVNPLNATKE